MKKIFLFFIVALMAFCEASASKKDGVIRKSAGSVTFVVDENLPAPDEFLGLYEGRRIAGFILQNNGIDRDHYGIVSTSFDNASLANLSYFNMLVQAYATHRPLVITPDDVWLLISQGLAHHINQNAETLRSKIVNHDGKITLVAMTNQALLGKDDIFVIDGKPVDWTSIFDQFVAQMKKNTKGDIVKNMCADFSTTTVESRIASRITLMNALQPYFNYEVGRIVCGIPYITLKGTPEDWQKILDRARSLEQYDLGWWTGKLCPVLEEFVKTAKGKPNRQFWRCMMTQIAPDKVRGPGCGGNGGVTLFDGWFLSLFPYDAKGRTPDKVTSVHDMLKDVVFADFKYKIYDMNGKLLKETPMQFYSGFVGVEENHSNYELKARIGWFVRTNEK